MDGDAVRPLVARLAECLERLSLPAVDHLAYLADLGVDGLADELALEFDDVFRPLLPLMASSADWSAVLPSLRAIDVALSDDRLEWHSDALEHSPGWAEVRRLATTALGVLRQTEGIRYDG